MKTPPQDLRCWVQRNAPSLLSAQASDEVPPAGTRFFRLHPRLSREATASGGTCGVPSLVPLGWLALNLMGAGAQVSGDGSRPPGSRPPSAQALCLRRSWTGAESCFPCSLPLLFRVVRSPLPLLPSGLGSHVGTANLFVANLRRPAPRAGPDLHGGIGPQPKVVWACPARPGPRNRASQGCCVPEHRCGRRASITSPGRGMPLTEYGP